MKNNILILIPARGGSKGIPRKNLRALADKPLIYYSIRTALNSKYKPDVYVTTDDDEIAVISKKLGAKVINREPEKAQDHTTLDPVIFDGYCKASEKENKTYDLIVTLQPTSPLLKSISLDDAIGKIINESSIDTIISAKDNTHLTWKQNLGKFVPSYKKRVNRQYLDPIYKETGGFLITRSSVISENNRIGKNVFLHILQGGEDIDIDTYEDWSLCEFYLKRKKVLFVVSGYREIGLGHVYNTLLTANNILNHHVEFLVDNKSYLALEKISSKNYRAYMQENINIVDDILKLVPDVVINDCLDTTADYVQSLKMSGTKVINFEDLGSGAMYADLVINAIYPEQEISSKHYFGNKYFVLRDEFILTQAKEPSESIKSVLLTFGGIDPNNYTYKVVDAIHKYCFENNIEICIVTGFGYNQYETLKKYQGYGVKVFKDCSDISEHMSHADIIFTSAGRTAYEVAALQVPSIVLAQNERELTHLFASSEHGFLNLGLGALVSKSELLSAFKKLAENYELRFHMSKLMAKTDLTRGRKRVNKLISDILEQV